MSMDTAHIWNRYQRQLILEGWGETAQHKMNAARVLVVGAGGLGAPLLQYLVAAGVGTIGIVDDDVVDISNLQRQVLFTTDDIGRTKTSAAAARLKAMNPDSHIYTYDTRLSNQNAIEIFSEYDIIADASDNFSTRYMVNDACVITGKPLVYGAVSKYEGQFAVFNARSDTAEITTNYRDLFPEPPAAGEVAACDEAGVVGVLPGIIGSMQAGEVIKLITGIGKLASNQIKAFNLLTQEWNSWELSAQTYKAPSDRIAFEAWDYSLSCATEPALQVDPATLRTWLQQKRCWVVDIRERNELPTSAALAHVQWPISEWNEQEPALPADEIVVCCQSGQRGARVLEILSERFPTKKFYNLAGGIQSWLSYRQKN